MQNLSQLDRFSSPICQQKKNSFHFDHDKLDVYQASLDLVVLTDGIIGQLPKGKGYITDQLQRAALSVPLNIAEGAGEYSSSEKSRFYRMAKRSATECAGILDVCYRLTLIDEDHYNNGRELILRIVAMLIKMAKAHN